MSRRYPYRPGHGSKQTCPKCQKGVYDLKTVVPEILYRVRRGAKPLSWYQCPHHDGWLHLTSKASRAPRPQ